MIESLQSHNEEDYVYGSNSGNGNGRGFGSSMEVDDVQEERMMMEEKDDLDIDFDQNFDNDDILEGNIEEQEIAETVEESNRSRKELVNSGKSNGIRGQLDVGLDDEDEDHSDSDNDSDSDDELVTGNQVAVGGIAADKRDLVEASARELKWHLKQGSKVNNDVAVSKLGSASANPKSSSSSPVTTVPAPGNVKRSRPGDSATTLESNQPSDKRAKMDGSPVTTTSTASAAVTTTFELSDAGIRAYIKYIGGKITTRDLAQVMDYLI